MLFILCQRALVFTSHISFQVNIKGITRIRTEDHVMGKFGCPIIVSKCMSIYTADMLAQNLCITHIAIEAHDNSELAYKP